MAPVVQAILPAEGVILEFGAGRGKWAQNPEFRSFHDFRAPGREVVGIDPDEAVLGNPMVDKAYVSISSSRGQFSSM
jgi:hypothetical protein